MKRSEMIEHISEELLDIMEIRFSTEKETQYCKRKAADLLDMIEGFGMLPPAAAFIIDWERWDPDRKEWYPTKERISSRKWEDEVTETEQDVTKE